MKKRTKIIVGSVCMAVGLAGSTMDIDTTWHYFGNGIIFGVGISLLVSGIKAKKGH